jgi:hypothetical protein
VAAVLAVGLLVSSAHAQRSSRPKPIRGDVHRMEVNNGATQTVRYFSVGLSPGESTTVREMEQLENELLFARDVQSLKREYVADERTLETHRAEVQRDLYGLDVTRSFYSAGAFGGSSYRGVYPYYASYGYGSGSGSAALVGGGVSVNASLANGVGDEGAIKNALARVVAQQATPEYMASLDRAYDRVAMRASASPTLRVAFGLPSQADLRRERDRIRTVDVEMTPSAPIMLTLKGGEKVMGRKMKETKEWLIVEKMNGGEARIRPSEVVRIDINDKGKVVPAAD